MGDTRGREPSGGGWTLAFQWDGSECPVGMSRVWGPKRAAARLTAEAPGKVGAGCLHPEQRDGEQGQGALGQWPTPPGAAGARDRGGGTERAQCEAHLGVFLFGLCAGTQTSQRGKHGVETWSLQGPFFFKNHQFPRARQKAAAWPGPPQGL